MFAYIKYIYRERQRQRGWMNMYTICIYVGTYMHAYILLACIHTEKHIYICMLHAWYIYSQTLMLVCLHIFIHTYLLTNTCTHIQLIHICLQTYIIPEFCILRCLEFWISKMSLFPKLPEIPENGNPEFKAHAHVFMHEYMYECTYVCMLCIEPQCHCGMVLGSCVRGAVQDWPESKLRWHGLSTPLPS